MKLDIKTIRKLKRQLSSRNIHPKDGKFFSVSVPRMTVDGVVIIGLCWMHPKSFQDIFGEEAYQELLKLPRVPSPYRDEMETSGETR